MPPVGRGYPSPRLSAPTAWGGSVSLPNGASPSPENFGFLHFKIVHSGAFS